jgi:heme-degrading monooxygenase HmoA
LVDVPRDAARMSVVKINAVTVPEGMGDDFMERFAKRAGSVESQPGFEEFLLLKPTDGMSPFYVFTRWESEEAFEAWMGGSDFRRAHGTDGEASAEARPAGPPGVSAELLSFDVVERVTSAG